VLHATRLYAYTLVGVHLNLPLPLTGCPRHDPAPVRDQAASSARLIRGLALQHMALEAAAAVAATMAVNCLYALRVTLRQRGKHSTAMMYERSFAAGLNWGC
jgi:hypothetical protein